MAAFRPAAGNGPWPVLAGTVPDHCLGMPAGQGMPGNIVPALSQSCRAQARPGLWAHRPAMAPGHLGLLALLTLAILTWDLLFCFICGGGDRKEIQFEWLSAASGQCEKELDVNYVIQCQH